MLAEKLGILPVCTVFNCSNFFVQEEKILSAAIINNKISIFYLLKKLMHIDQWELTQSWNGIYPIMTNGATDLFLNPEPGVYILNGIGGHGMTMSFGFAEEMIETI